MHRKVYNVLLGVPDLAGFLYLVRSTEYGFDD